MADKTILQGYEALSKARAKQADIAGSFSKAYDFAGRKARKEQEIIDTNNKVADRMNGLEGNINFNAVEDPKLREAVGSFAVLDKDIYANAAIAIGNIKNSADPEYQRLIGQMNDVNNNFNGVRDELVYISTLGAQYQEVMDTEGGFSAGIQNTEEFKAMAEIFGGGGNYSVSVENGHIIYDVNGKKYNASDLALPMKKAFPIAQAILESNKEMYDTNRELNVDDIELLRLRYNNQFANENALRSILSDADFGDIIATEDIDIDEMGVDAARELFVNRLIEANKASARRGITNKDKYGRDTRTSDQKNEDALRADTQEAWEGGSIVTIPYQGGGLIAIPVEPAQRRGGAGTAPPKSWIVTRVDKDGDVMEENFSLAPIVYNFEDFYSLHTRR